MAARVSKTAFDVVMYELQRQATATQLSIIRNYVSLLEQELETYQRALKAAQEGQSKFWLEVRPDPDSRRSVLELSGRSTLAEVSGLASEHATAYPRDEIWVVSRDGGFDLLYGTDLLNKLIEREAQNAAGIEPSQVEDVLGGKLAEP